MTKRRRQEHWVARRAAPALAALLLMVAGCDADAGDGSASTSSAGPRANNLSSATSTAATSAVAPPAASTTAPSSGPESIPATATRSAPATTSSSGVGAKPSPPVSGPPGVAGAGRDFGPPDDGAVVSLKVGEAASLILPDPTDPDPRVRGSSVELAELFNVAASNRREWEVRAVRPGTTVIAGDRPSPWTLTFEVT